MSADDLRWRCEIHDVTTTGDCPKCDDELIALHEQSASALVADPFPGMFSDDLLIAYAALVGRLSGYVPAETYAEAVIVARKHVAARRNVVNVSFYKVPDNGGAA